LRRFRVAGHKPAAVTAISTVAVLEAPGSKRPYGDTAFTVPMFDAFMKRSLPDWVAPNHRSAEH
jgi:hypothetical protein